MEFIQKLKEITPLKLTETEEQKLSTELGEPIKVVDTSLSGDIKVWKIESLFLIEEYDSLEDFYWIRTLETQQDVDDLIKDRLETYENMWGGCGCHVRYGEKFSCPNKK
ncbi:hypothetical protein M0811_04089 [Anaeramoeba ignava]|uniref:Uncharacterized protein n=1 Tax=Anaeramoeba ignava TaxID=1746090 RepID=A0A9Q0LTQ2_ANAIG|nr:hypothetical protein M0811_04089 [Anaeramoeba ignava]|eukprot:Anaeramoba_ignava/a353154_60.p1 GENE.a353154_60~~a353154_60.p1  ORF type:complete len:109 (+),score=34.28 a353154_60:26-352(+)